MIVRKIKEEELKRTSELFSIAFEFPDHNWEKSPEEVARQCRENPDSPIQKYALEKWAAFEDDDKTMMAFIGGTPYDVEFDGHTVKMSGVGGVSSMGQYRRQGAIRGCFQQYLRDLYDTGFVFSTLYPFSASYYRQYGYERGEDLTGYRIPVSAIPKFDVGGHVRLVEQGEGLADAMKVFDAFRQGLNMASSRTELDYSWITRANPAKDCVYTYIYYNEGGEPKGVMTFTKASIGDAPDGATHYQISCQRFYFVDMEGLKGLLRHCKAFEMYYDFVSFLLPQHMRIEDLIPERSFRQPLSLRRNMNGMVRAVNVQRALELARYRGSGEFTVRVHDGMLPENDKCFHIRFQEGRALSVKTTESAAPDAELGINDFSRFLLGTHRPEEMGYVEAARFNAPTEKIGQVFYKKPIFITENF